MVVLRLQGLRLGPQQLADFLVQPRAEQRFADESVHPGFLRRILDVGPVVGRGQQDGDIRTDFRPDAPDRPDAVQIRHLQVQHDHVIVLPALMPLSGHLQRLQAAPGLVRTDPQRIQCVRRGLQQDRVVVREQDLDALDLHLLQLLFGHRQVQRDGEGRPLFHLALALDRPFHQVDHLPRDRQAQPGPLYAVDPAVRLPRKRLVHLFQELGAHAHPGVRDAVNKLHTAFFFALLLLQVHRHAAARHRVFDGVGEDVDVDLVQPQLIGIKIFLLHPVDTDVEVDVLLLDHRLRQVHQVLHGLHDREGHRAQVQFPALHLRDVQDVVDQRQQVVAGQADLSQVFRDGLLVVRFLLGDRGQADDRVHRSADVVRHCRQKIGFRLIGGVRFPGRDLQLLIDRLHVQKVHHQQKQQPEGDDPDQDPVLRNRLQIGDRCRAQQHPALRGCDGGMGDQAFPAFGIQHRKRPCPGQNIRKQLLLFGDPGLIVGFIELEEAGVFERTPLDDIVALVVDDGELFVLVLFLREDPFFLQVGYRHDAQQIGLLLLPALFVPHCDPVAEGQRLLPVDGVGIGPGDVDRLAEIGDPGPVPEQVHPLVGDLVPVLGARARPRGIALQAFRVDQVGRRALAYMGRPDIVRRFFQRQVPAVDILCPVVTDSLFPYHVVSRHALHGDRRVDEVFYLVMVVFFLLMVGIQRDEDQYGRHHGDVRHDDPQCPHTAHFVTSSPCALLYLYNYSLLPFSLSIQLAPLSAKFDTLEHAAGRRRAEIPFFRNLSPPSLSVFRAAPLFCPFLRS